MQPDFRTMWTELGLDLQRHDQLLAAASRSLQRTHLWQPNRPDAMALFDQAFHAAHASRVSEIWNHRKAGGRVIGTFCIYVPEEIALAAGVIAIPLCGGNNESVAYADRMLPRDICPLVRSTFGMALSNTCPYKSIKDFAVGETTCDAKKKAWDISNTVVLEVPHRKAPVDRQLWLSEVKRFFEMMQELSGLPITAARLKEAIAVCDRRRILLQQISALRALDEPPISGLDALLVSQVALNQDIQGFVQSAELLLSELRDRVQNKQSAYSEPGRRVLVAGSPSPMGNAKLHYVIESSGMRIVADESCTGSRYFRDCVGPTPDDLDGMVEAIANRYFEIDCACFSPNSERLDHISKTLDQYRVQGVIHNILQFCHGYDIEAYNVDRMLKKRSVPSIKIVTDYAEQDIESIRVRLEAFREVISQ
jgi:benzoyl-CoA reductase/2-hydroxyglutaryl-CoA dehydratase subunit BcrC/BadD/HgdB